MSWGALASAVLAVAAAALCLLAAWYLLPRAALRWAIRGLGRLLYGLKLEGNGDFVRYPKRSIIVADFSAPVYAPLIACALPDDVLYIVDRSMLRRPGPHLLKKIVRFMPWDPARPLALRGLIAALDRGVPLVVAPEGRRAISGGQMKVFEGPAVLADRGRAPIVPVHIDPGGATIAARLLALARHRPPPAMRIVVGEPVTIDVPPEIQGRQRRAIIASRFHDINTGLMFSGAQTGLTLWQAFLRAARHHGWRREIVEDQDRRPLTYRRFALEALALGRMLAPLAPPGGRVGVLMPTSVPGALAVMALQAAGRVPAVLNFSAGAVAAAAACRLAGIGAVVTSRGFIEKARLGDLVSGLGPSVKVHYLEDLGRAAGWRVRVRAALELVPPWRSGPAASADDPALVLFTSGSEGAPKGVVLSHRNIVSNIEQVAARVDFTPRDLLFNPLPFFQSFALSDGLFLPLLRGMKVILFPTPLQYRAVPELIYQTGATILFGTDTFLQGYAKASHPYDFYSVRYVFAGAEKLKDATRALYAERFGVRILEGYGVTECGPAIAVNTGMQFKTGSVGRLLPGIEARLQPVEGIGAGGGRLAVRGPNVMLGYLEPDGTGLAAPAAGWHETGDIARLDVDGFLTIIGRTRRFARIGGEMVPLGAIEQEAATLWPDHVHAAVALPDAAQGERVVLATTNPAANRSILAEHMHRRGLAELMLPKAIVTVENLPLLPGGKPDYPSVRLLVEAIEG